MPKRKTVGTDENPKRRAPSPEQIVASSRSSKRPLSSPENAAGASKCPQRQQSSPGKSAGASKSPQRRQSSPGKSAGASKSPQRRQSSPGKSADVSKSPQRRPSTPKKTDSARKSPRRQSSPGKSAGASKSPQRRPSTPKKTDSASKSPQRRPSTPKKTDSTSKSPQRRQSAPGKSAGASKSPQRRPSTPKKTDGASKSPQRRPSTPKKTDGTSKSPQRRQSSPGKSVGESPRRSLPSLKRAASNFQRRRPPARKNDGAVRSPKYAVKCVFLPSLEHMSGVDIAQSLWMNERVQKQLCDWRSQKTYEYFIYRQDDKPEDFGDIEEQVFNYASQDETFTALFSRHSRGLKTLKSFIKGVGFELLNWLSFHDDVFGSSVGPDQEVGTSAASCINCIKWSTTGCIDYEATAYNMIAGNVLTDMHKYRLSCVYCLKNEVNIFGAKVANYIKDTRETDGKCAYLIAFWNATFCNERSDGEAENPEQMLIDYCIDNIPIDHLLYKHAAYANNEAALKYLHKYAPHLQIFEYMDDFFRQGVKSARILYLVLSQLDYKEQKSALNFQKNFLFLLDSLLNDWLWIDFFCNVVNCFRARITNSMLCELLDKLGNILVGDKSTLTSATGISGSFERSDKYHIMLKTIWTSMTEKQKAYMFNNNPREADSRFVNNVLPYLDYEEKVEVFQYLLSDVDLDTKKTIARSVCNMQKCLLLLRTQKYEFLDRVIDLIVVSDGASEDLIVKKMDFRESLLRFEECFFVRHVVEDHVKNAALQRTTEVLTWAFPCIHAKENFVDNTFVCVAFETLLHLTFRNAEINESEIFPYIEHLFGDDKGPEKLRSFRESVRLKEQVCSLAIELVIEYKHHKADSLLLWHVQNPVEMRGFKHNVLAQCSQLLIRAVNLGGASLLLRIWIFCFLYVGQIRDFIDLECPEELMNDLLVAILEKWGRLQADYIIEYFIKYYHPGQVRAFKLSFVETIRSRYSTVSSRSAEFEEALNIWSRL